MRVILFILLTINAYAQNGWNIVDIPVNTNLNSLYFPDTLNGYIATENGEYLKTTNSGKNWERYNSGVSQELVSINFSNDSVGFLLTSSGYLYKTINNGISWNLISNGFGIGKSMYFFDENIGYIISSIGQPTYSIHCYFTNNGGQNWAQSTITTGNINFNSAQFPDPVHGFYANNNNIYKSSNYGYTWERSITNYASNSIFNFIDENVGFMGSNFNSNSIVLKTTDGGLNWTIIFQEPGHTFRNGFFINHTTGYLLKPNGPILFTSNSGNHWFEQFNSENINTLYYIKFISNNIGFAFGSNGKLLRTSNGGTPIGMGNFSYNLPGEFVLHNNYPNPFNSSTVIKYEVNIKTNITFSLYSLTGSNIYNTKSLKNPGKYTINFSAENLASGIYFYSMESEKWKEVRKMILLK